MKRAVFTVAIAVLAVMVNISSADTFGTGASEFTIEFVDISGDSGDLGSWSAGDSYSFSGVNHGDYRIGTYEITNDQFAKFAANNSGWTGAYVTATDLSWYNAAQFVNFLNTSTGYQAAYKITELGYTVWEVGDVGYDALNPFRNSNAHYFLPTEAEWVKAAYWNGTSLQTHATKPGESLFQGDGTNGGWNYGHDYVPRSPCLWIATNGSQELNGTYNMMGNAWEWFESPFYTGDYLSGVYRGIRGGSFQLSDFGVSSSYRFKGDLSAAGISVGFRVASVLEPATLLLLGLGALVLRKRKQ